MRILLVLPLLLSRVAAEDRHWAYVPPVRAEGGAALDGILEKAWAARKLEPAALAPPRQWLERAAYTLTGLPPSEEQIRRIESSPDEATWAALVDELLASPAYGERWARHWMDVARYADTRGYNFDQDNRYPFAYTYRDWLIRAFNSDLPYDRFIKLQIAADHLVDRPDHPDLAALGFLTVGPRGGPVETIDDRVDVVTRGFLSSTVSCARCHDHKTDPISTKDYYSLYSILEHTEEPEDKPVIGPAADAAAFEAYRAEVVKLDEADRAARQALVDHLRSKEALPNYLELAWRARKENWDQGRASSEGFQRGRLRPNALMRWKDFLGEQAGAERVKRWLAEMDAAADDAARTALCAALAAEWTTAAEGSELASLSAKGGCPLSYGVDRVQEIYDVEDAKEQATRRSAMAKLMAEHPGSPPRAMSLRDKAQWGQAVVFERGNPAARGEVFDRHWLSFLGGGPFDAGKSPRLSLAEKIADPANPLTARVIVNRVWAWHFGAPLAEPGDFGPQTPRPELLPLLDALALAFQERGGSLKELHRLLLRSKAFRLAADGAAANDAIDQANTLCWKWNRRRLDFETMRDRVLASSGALDAGGIGGRPVRLEDTAADARRSVYAFVDRYALPGTFVSFDLPHPDHHSPKRVETTVPQQALYFLNGPLVLRQAARLAGDPAFKSLPDDRARIEWIYRKLFRRAPTYEERLAALDWIAAANPADYTPPLGGRWEVLHGPDEGKPSATALPFPLFADQVWKTAPDPATAAIPWLQAGAGGGHASAGHTLVLRWRATGAGEVRMSGRLTRSQKGGDTLAWRIDGKGAPLAEARLAPGSAADIAGTWIRVEPGDTMDFVLRAPEGHAYGHVGWTLRIEGRDDAAGPPREIGDFTRQFPVPGDPPPPPAAADPWADLIQMLWASNEFHFVD